MNDRDIIATDAQAKGAWPLYRALVGVGIICALLIVSVFLFTLPQIERNRAEALDRAILLVLPGATEVHTFELEQAIHAAYDDSGELLGLALETQAMGYQDTVRVLYSYDPKLQAIVGIQVLESRETPGLGDKIEKDKTFLKNFRALDVRVSPDGQTLVHPIEFVKPGQKFEQWQIDGISGATISSEAVATMLRSSSGYWVPRLYAMRDKFTLPKEAGNGI
jgi:H+/Na+-translocating ferredoxin:NAD+ oxidoreductase subunit G